MTTRNSSKIGSPPLILKHRWTALLVLILLHLCQSSWCSPVAQSMPSQLSQLELSASLYPSASASAPSSSSSSSSSVSEKRTSRMQYGFGLGKRHQSPVSESTEIVELPQSFFPTMPSPRSDLIYVIYPVDPQMMFAPFAPVFPPKLASINYKDGRAQRPQSGFDKRSKEQLFNDYDSAIQLVESFEPAKVAVYNTEKRKVQPYGFGLGKRLIETSDNRKIKKLTNFEEFMKRRYSFGLGKRSV